MHILQVAAVISSIVLIVFVVEAIRRNRLNARYALLWLGACFVLLLLSLYRPLLDRLALALGVAYPPSLLFLVVFIFLLGIVLHYSLVLSSHRESIRRLTQSLALLEADLKRGLEAQRPRVEP